MMFSALSVHGVVALVVLLSLLLIVDGSQSTRSKPASSCSAAGDQHEQQCSEGSSNGLPSLFQAPCNISHLQHNHGNFENEFHDTVFYLRSFDGHVGLLAWLMQSWKVFMPPETRLVAVLDPDSFGILGGNILPLRNTQIFEESLPKGEGYTWAQYSYLLADLYVTSERSNSSDALTMETITRPKTAKYIAMLDSDMIFNTWVSRERLFVEPKKRKNRKKKSKKADEIESSAVATLPEDRERPLILWHDSTYLTDRWRRSTEELLGMPMTGDFMVQLPFIVPTFVLRELREHVMKRHNTTTFLAAWKKVIMDPATKYRTPKAGYTSCQFCIIGTFIHHKFPDTVVFRNPPAEHIPTLRVARHLGWEPFAYDGTERRAAKLTPEYAVQAGRGIFEGHCTAVAYHCKEDDDREVEVEVGSRKRATKASDKKSLNEIAPLNVSRLCSGKDSKYRKLQSSLFMWQGELSGPLPSDDRQM